MFEYVNNLFKCKEDVICLIDEKGMLIEEFKNEILSVIKLVEVEDFYRLYKEKKKIKVIEVIVKGLELFVKFLLFFLKMDVLEEVNKYFNDEVLIIKDVFEGVGFIILEFVSDDVNYCKYLRDYLFRYSVLIFNLRKNGKELDVKGVYEIYYDYS